MAFCAIIAMNGDDCGIGINLLHDEQRGTERSALVDCKSTLKSVQVFYASLCISIHFHSLVEYFIAFPFLSLSPSQICMF